MPHHVLGLLNVLLRVLVDLTAFEGLPSDGRQAKDSFMISAQSNQLPIV